MLCLINMPCSDVPFQYQTLLQKAFGPNSAFGDYVLQIWLVTPFFSKLIGVLHVCLYVHVVCECVCGVCIYV